LAGSHITKDLPDLDLIEEAVRNNLRGEVKVPARKKVFKGSRVKSSI